MTEEYPRGAYLLLLIGGILEIIVGVSVVLAATMFLVVESSSSSYMLGQMPGFMPIYSAVCLVVDILWFLIWGVLMIIAAKWVKTGNQDKVHKGAILGLIASILGLNLISLIGAILALTWKPPLQEQAQGYNVPPPPPPT